MTAGVVTRPIGTSSRDGGQTPEITVRVTRGQGRPREWRRTQLAPGLRLISWVTVRTLVLIAVATLLILGLLPAALGAQLASAS
jgi:hypothetical protein